MLSLAFHHCPTDIDLSNISQVIAFEDDSLEILFKDHSTLQLSPCGANFKYTRPHSSIQPSLSQHMNEICQRSIFATSETRSKIVQGIMIRNQLSERPYLPPDLLEHMGLKAFRLHREFEAYEWPNADDIKLENKQVRYNSDGSTTVFSRNNLAQLVLFPDCHRVQVSFAVPLSKCNKDFSMPETDSQMQTNIRLMHVWQSRIFPVSLCPIEWKHPLEIALIRSRDGGKSSKNFKNCRTPFAVSTQRTCEKQFSHRWRNIVSYHSIMGDPGEMSSFVENFSVADSVIKFTWCENVSYWMVNHGHPKIEAWLTDGGIIKSHPTTDRYFIHIYPFLMNDITCSKSDLYYNGRFTEKVISTAAIPAQNDTMKTILLKCIRMTICRQEELANLARNISIIPCWKSDQNMLPESKACEVIYDQNCDVNEKVCIPGVGKFSVANDSIQIKFEDGSVLHMIIDVSSARRTGKTFTDLFTPGQCRIMLANGQYFVIDDPQQFSKDVAKYMKHAFAWFEWISMTSEKKAMSPFYCDTIHNEDNVGMVSQELDKIKKMTKTTQYLELSERHSAEGSKFTVCSNFRDVSNALSHTSKAIDDLDELIALFRK